jgi:hypothetical protein
MSRWHSDWLPGSNLPGGQIFLAVETGSEGRPVSCAIDTGSFPGVKKTERGADHQPSSDIGLRVR